MHAEKSRHARSAAWCLCLVLLISFARAAAAAEESATDFLRPRLDRQTYIALCERLELDRNLRSIADLLYADYTNALDEIAAAADAAADDAGRPRLRDALHGRVRMSPDELRETRIAVLTVYRQQTWSRSDARLQQFFDELTVMLSDPQQTRAATVYRDLRRTLWLRPRRAGESFPEYAGDGVDLVTLVDRARREGGELEGLRDRELEDALASYVAQLDAILPEIAAADREGLVQLRVHRLREDGSGVRREEQAALDRWQRFFELTQRTALRIADRAEAMRGPDARSRWMGRFHAACFPWLWRPAKVDRQFEWLRDQPLDAETRQKAEKIYDNYRTRRREHLEAAITLMLQGRLQRKRLIHPSIDATSVIDDRGAQALYEDLLKNSGERENVERSAIYVLEAVLPEDVRKQLRKRVR